MRGRYGRDRCDQLPRCSPPLLSARLVVRTRYMTIYAVCESFCLLRLTRIVHKIFRFSLAPPALSIVPGSPDSDVATRVLFFLLHCLRFNGIKIILQDGGSVQSDKPSAAAEKAAAAHVKSLEAQYGANVKVGAF